MDFPVEQYLSDGVDPAETIAMPRAVGVLRVDDEEQLKASLAKCENVRSITIEANIATLPAWLRRCRRLRELEITSYDLTSLPAWLSELEDLRHLSLNRCSDLKKIPDHVWKIPRLESLWLFHTTFAKLDGIEKAHALREVIAYSEELAPQLPAIAKRIEAAKGITAVKVNERSIRIERRPTARLSGNAKKDAAHLASLPRGFDCSGIDLSGQTFEDLDVQVDLQKAKLGGTTWRRCRFQHTNMSGALAAKAVFDHCHFEGNTTMTKLKAPGIVLRCCNLGAPMEGSDLEGAVIEDTAPDSFLKLSGCKLKGAKIEAVYTTPQNGSHADLSKADLRGAHVAIRLTDEAAARLAKSKTRFQWKKANTKGAKVDKQTSIEHVALGQPKAASKPAGPAASSVGTLCGSNAACWFVVADANVAREWKGSHLNEDYEELPGTDFSRALTSRKGEIKIGSGKGVLADVGDCGCSNLWLDGKSWCLLDARASADVDRRSKEGQHLIGTRVAQLPAKRTTKLGRFDVRSGCMTLLLPYREHPFTEKQIAAAKKSGKVLGVPNDHDGLLVPAPNGAYEVSYEHLSHEDEVGAFYTRIRIAPVGR
jgi:uncharacterized protein YjbI with pentapeptide repeats